jgi:glutamyl-tRNA synthetase/glutamyl-Q tRNA(Asp) synthetase
VANALFVWGCARASGREVVLRIEDHDRQRSRPEYARALLEDLAWLGFEHDRGPYTQADEPQVYETALRSLADRAPVYGCDCSRASYAAWADVHGHGWRGSGCPNDCRSRGLTADAAPGIRVALPDRDESWTDLRLGPQHASPTVDGDLLVRDRDGNWTYSFCVVIDDERHGIDLVVRGEDLLATTGRQLSLARVLGRPTPPLHLHHPLILKPDGSKLSKAEGDTSVRELRATGASPADLIGRAAAAVGLIGRPGTLSAMDGAALAAATVSFS